MSEIKRTLDRNNLGELLNEVHDLALVDLEQWAEQWRTADLAEIERFLDGVVVHLARKAAYLSARAGGGCGNQGHQTGVRWQNQRAARIRKAIGYTYPKDDISF